MTNVYHAHLDVCAQCREHPFNLCAEGYDALKRAALGEAPLTHKSETGEHYARAVRRRAAPVKR